MQVNLATKLTSSRGFSKAPKNCMHDNLKSYNYLKSLPISPKISYSVLLIAEYYYSKLLVQLAMHALTRSGLAAAAASWGWSRGALGGGRRAFGHVAYFDLYNIIYKVTSLTTNKCKYSLVLSQTFLTLTNFVETNSNIYDIKSVYHETTFQNGSNMLIWNHIATFCNKIDQILISLTWTNTLGGETTSTLIIGAGIAVAAMARGWSRDHGSGLRPRFASRRGIPPVARRPEPEAEGEPAGGGLPVAGRRGGRARRGAPGWLPRAAPLAPRVGRSPPARAGHNPFPVSSRRRPSSRSSASDPSSLCRRPSSRDPLLPKLIK